MNWQLVVVPERLCLNFSSYFLSVLQVCFVNKSQKAVCIASNSLLFCLNSKGKTSIDLKRNVTVDSALTFVIQYVIVSVKCFAYHLQGHICD
jgi:hypothetical protein